MFQCFETRSLIAKVSLELLFLLPKCWDYRPVLPHLVSFFLTEYFNIAQVFILKIILFTEKISHIVAYTGLELATILLQSFECEDYRYYYVQQFYILVT